jgi:hypothetical protein
MDFSSLAQNAQQAIPSVIVSQDAHMTQTATNKAEFKQ